MSNSCDELMLLQQMLHHAQRSAIQAELAAAGLQEVGHPMLMSILKSSDDGLSPGRSMDQRELSDALHVSPAAVAASLKSLERAGYLRRERLDGDQRRNQIIITEKGRAAVAECSAAIQRVHARIFRDFAPEELAQLHSFRRRMLHNLQQTAQHQEERKDPHCSNCF